MSQSIILPSAVRTATNNSADIFKSGEKSIHAMLAISNVPGVDSVTLNIQGKDALGNYYNIASSAATITAINVPLRVGSGITATANVAISEYLPDVYRFQVVHSNNTPFTYSLTSNVQQ